LNACYLIYPTKFKKKLKKNAKLKFKIKDHRISTKTEFAMPKLKVFRKKNLKHFWSKFGAPPEFWFIEYHRVSLIVMTISCKTWLLFVAAAFKIKNSLNSKN
jgi:hypothetical protein